MLRRRRGSHRAPDGFHHLLPIAELQSRADNAKALFAELAELLPGWSR
jgi:hypothetical protein